MILMKWLETDKTIMLWTMMMIKYVKMVAWNGHHCCCFRAISVNIMLWTMMMMKYVKMAAWNYHHRCYCRAISVMKYVELMKYVKRMKCVKMDIVIIVVVVEQFPWAPSGWGAVLLRPVPGKTAGDGGEHKSICLSNYLIKTQMF